MSGFWYYLPGITRERLVGAAPSGPVDREVLEARGLADVLADVEQSPRDLICANVAKAPDKGAGALLYPVNQVAAAPENVTYQPAAQTWSPVGDGKQRWIGVDPAAPPTPDDLQRRLVHFGYTVTAADGQGWQIPIARPAPGGTVSLPCDYYFDQDGAAVRARKPQFEDIWTISGIVFDYYHKPPAEVVDPGDAYFAEAAVRVLVINYRLGPAELTALYEHGVGVLDRNSVQWILMALIDQQIEREAEKKTSPDIGPSAPDGSSSGDGTPAETPTTDPAAASCS